MRVVTGDLTYMSEIRCGTSMINVSERYVFGKYSDTATASIVAATNGAMSTHLRRTATCRMSSGVYFLPGSTLLTPPRNPQRQTGPDAVAFESTGYSGRQLNTAI